MSQSLFQINVDSTFDASAHHHVLLPPVAKRRVFRAALYELTRQCGECGIQMIDLLSAQERRNLRKQLEARR